MTAPRRTIGSPAGRAVALAAALVWAATAPGAAGRPAAQAADASPCTATAARHVSPPSVAVGEPATVTAVLRIQCPAAPGPTDVVLTIDRSASMIGAALAAAKHAAGVFVDLVDLGRVRVAIVAFDDVATIEVPLSSWASRLRGAIAGVTVPPAAGTDLVRALSASGQALAAGDDPGRERRLKAVVLLTDGQNNRGPEPVLQQAAVQRGAGVHLTTVSLGRRADRALLAQVATTPADHWPSPTTADLAAIYARLAARLDTLAVRRLAVDDVVGPHLAPLAGSARPVAVVAGGRQRWTIPAAAGDAITLTYGLVPDRVGRWPVSDSTLATFEDALGRTGSVAVPIPFLEVVAPPPPGATTPSPTARPTATATADPTRPATSVATASATPSATAVGAPATPTPSATATAPPSAPPTAVHRRYLPVALAGACLPGAEPVDVVVALDASTTMLGLTASGRRKIDEATAGIGRLVDGLAGRAGVRIGLVRFNAVATDWAPLTDDLAAVRRALAEPIRPATGSRLDLGLGAAAAMLARAGPPAAHRAIVLVSDGLVFGATPDDVRAAAAAARAGGSVLYAVAVGPGAAAALLAEVAGAPARVFDAGDGDGFVAAFRAAVAALPCRPPATSPLP